MVNYTPNLNLAKPILSDVADITVISANFDILDSALAKMVTTDSPQEITGSKTFSGTVIVNGHNLRNAVTTDEVQNITGSKKLTMISTNTWDKTAGGLIRNVIPVDITNYTVPTNHYYGVESIVDNTDRYIVGRKINLGANGTYGVIRQIRLPNGSISTYSELTVNENSTYDITTQNLRADSPSSAIVNKAYVEATDGVTNNLVHKTASETISGEKTFTKIVKIQTNDWGNPALNVKGIGNSAILKLGSSTQPVRDGTTHYGGILSLVDTSDNAVGGIRGVTVSDNSGYLQLAGSNPNGSLQFNIDIRPDGMTIPTPSSSASSGYAVNKAYVESTDGTTNNLLHKTGVETVKNYKKGTMCNYIAPSEAVNHNGQYMRLIRFRTSALRILGQFTYVIGGSTGCAMAKFVIDPHANQFYLYDFYANDGVRRDYLKDICLAQKDGEWYVIMPGHRYHQPTMIIEQILNYGCYWITDIDTHIEYYNVTDATDNPNWMATKPVNGVDGWTVITPIIMAQVTQ